MLDTGDHRGTFKKLISPAIKLQRVQFSAQLFRLRAGSTTVQSGPQCSEPPGPAAQTPQPWPQPGTWVLVLLILPGPLALHQLPSSHRTRGLLHTFLEAGKRDLGNEKFALKCDFSCLTPSWDFQLILLNIFSWRYFCFRARGTERPMRSWQLCILQPKAQVIGCNSQERRRPYSSPSSVPLWKGMGRCFPRTSSCWHRTQQSRTVAGGAGRSLELWAGAPQTHTGHRCLASPRAGSCWPYGPGSSMDPGSHVLPCSQRTRGLGALRCAGCFTSAICFPIAAAIWLLPSLDTFFPTPCFSTMLRGCSMCAALAAAAISKSPAVKSLCCFLPLAAFFPRCRCSILLPPQNPQGTPSWFAGAFSFTPYHYTFSKLSCPASFPWSRSEDALQDPKKRA